MKLQKSDLEDNEYHVYIIDNGKTRRIVSAIEVDTDAKRVVFTVVSPANQVKLENLTPVIPDPNVVPDLEEIELDQKEFIGPFFVVDKDNKKILEVQ